VRPLLLLLCAACDASAPDVIDPADLAAADLAAPDGGPADLAAAPDLAEAAPDLAPACDWGESSDGVAHLLATWTLPATSMQVMNPFLTAGQLTDALANGANTVDAPGPGSGLDWAGGCDFYMVGDRGPNGDHTPDGKFFPMPAYTPAMMRVHGSGTALAIDQVLPFYGASQPITGLPNEAADDVPYLTANASSPLAYVADGMDTEDIRRLAGGDFAVVEEYSPSLAIVDGATGRVKVRYTPAGVLPAASYPVKDILPAVLVNRRVNKGFEGLAVDGTTAWAVLQTPLGDESIYGDSLVNRVVRVDHIDDPAQAQAGGQFVVLHNPFSAYPGATKQTQIFFNSATWIGGTRMLLLERAPGKLKLLAVDFAAATNILASADLTPESSGASGIQAATVTEVFDSDELPAIFQAPAPSKLEGLAIVNRTTVAITNDNDFGIVDAGDHTRIWIIRLKAPLY
jgi:Esterase-like activity of phytase